MSQKEIVGPAGIAATSKEALFFATVLTHMKNKPEVDWATVADKLSLANANVAKTRFGQIKKRLGLTDSSGETKTRTPRKSNGSGTNTTSSKVKKAPGKGSKVKVKVEKKEDEDSEGGHQHDEPILPSSSQVRQVKTEKNYDEESENEENGYGEDVEKQVKQEASDENEEYEGLTLEDFQGEIEDEDFFEDAEEDLSSMY